MRKNVMFLAMEMMITVGVTIVLMVVTGCASTEPRPFIDDFWGHYGRNGDCTNTLEVAAATVGDYTYTYVVTNGSAVITGPNETVTLRGEHLGTRFARAVSPAPTGILAIPAFLDDYPVISIGDLAFADYAKLESVTIPEGITSIRFFAFWKCHRLKSVTIPSSVTNISYNAFGSCRSLESVTILSSVASIEQDAFWRCPRLKNVTISKGVTVQSDAFPEGCKILRK